MTNMTKAGIAGFIALVAGVAIAGGDWSSAKSKADDFKSKSDELVREMPNQGKQIVSAACSATDDERGRAAESAASNARSHMNDKFNDLERLERDAVDRLEHVDDSHKDEARRLADEVKSRFSKVKDQTNDMRNGSSRIVEYMKNGERAMKDHSGHCDAHDVSMDAGHADCIVANGDTCKIIEKSSASSNAVSKARDRASRFKSQLEREIERKEKGEGSDLMKRLISNHSDFAKCKRVETRVDCYKQCPDVDSEGRLRESSPDWREGC
jgi:hypothetical protein